EGVVFEATLPGIDEELRFRGPLIALLTLAFGTRFGFLGGAGWGTPLTALLFGLAHGLRLTHDQGWSFDAVNTVYTGILGFGLGWMRERTGSVVLPILFHNVVNVGVALL